jgi:hypothetical protein
MFHGVLRKRTHTEQAEDEQYLTFQSEASPPTALEWPAHYILDDP